MSAGLSPVFHGEVEKSASAAAAARAASSQFRSLSAWLVGWLPAISQGGLCERRHRERIARRQHAIAAPIDRTHAAHRTHRAHQSISPPDWTSGCSGWSARWRKDVRDGVGDLLGDDLDDGLLEEALLSTYSADFSVPRQRFHAALGSSLITSSPFRGVPWLSPAPSGSRSLRTGSCFWLQLLGRRVGYGAIDFDFVGRLRVLNKELGLLSHARCAWSPYSEVPRP